MALAALAAELETQPRAADGDVPILQRGQAERAVGLHVLVVADADGALLEQLDDSGEHLVAGEAGLRQIGCGSRADLRERCGEVEHALVLGLVTGRAPVRVIAVLLAAARIAAGRLQVPAWVGADPDVRPCRRNRQPGDPRHFGGPADPAPVPEVLEPKTTHLAADRRTVVGDVAETGGTRRLYGVHGHGCALRTGPSPSTWSSLRTRPVGPTMAAASSTARARSASVSTVPVRWTSRGSRSTFTFTPWMLDCSRVPLMSSAVSSVRVHPTANTAVITMPSPVLLTRPPLQEEQNGYRNVSGQLGSAPGVPVHWDIP